MDLKRPKFIDDRMTCIVPAIEACHIIRALGEIINNFPFALVTPLRPDHRCDAHPDSFMNYRLLYQRSGRLTRYITLETGSSVSYEFPPRYQALQPKADNCSRLICDPAFQT